VLCPLTSFPFCLHAPPCKMLEGTEARPTRLLPSFCLFSPFLLQVTGFGRYSDTIAVDTSTAHRPRPHPPMIDSTPARCKHPESILLSRITSIFLVLIITITQLRTYVILPSKVLIVFPSSNHPHTKFRTNQLGNTSLRYQHFYMVVHTMFTSKVPGTAPVIQQLI